MNVAKEIQRRTLIPGVIYTILKLTNKCHSIINGDTFTYHNNAYKDCLDIESRKL